MTDERMQHFLKQMNARFDEMDRRFEGIDKEIKEFRAEVSKKFDGVASLFLSMKKTFVPWKVV